MSSPEEGTEFCRQYFYRQYYYLAMALSRINFMLKTKLLKIHKQKERTKSNLCLWLNGIKTVS